MEWAEVDVTQPSVLGWAVVAPLLGDDLESVTVNEGSPGLITQVGYLE